MIWLNHGVMVSHSAWHILCRLCKAWPRGEWRYWEEFCRATERGIAAAGNWSTRESAAGWYSSAWG